MADKSAHSLFLLFGQVCVNRSPCTNNKSLKVCLFVRVSLLVHNFKRLPDHVLDQLVLSEMLLLDVKVLLLIRDAWFLSSGFQFQVASALRDLVEEARS